MSLDSPTLILPNNEKRVSQLRDKMKEYAQRFENYKRDLQEQNEYWHPEQVELFSKQSSSYTKLAVLSELFLEENINTADFSLELGRKLKNEFEGTTGRTFNVELYSEHYNQACAIIDDYCKTGGANCRGGTGLN